MPASKQTDARRKAWAQKRAGEKVFPDPPGPTIRRLAQTGYGPGFDPGLSTVASVTVTDTQECVDPAKSAGTEAA